MIITEIVVIAFSSILRKKTYKYLIVSMVAPIILSTILLSIPNISMLVNFLSKRIITENINLISFRNHQIISGVCSPIEIAGMVQLGEIELPLIIASSDLLVENIVNFKEVTKSNDFVSMPMKLYKEKFGDGIVINGVKRNISHIHTGIHAVIILVNKSINNDIELCNVNSLDMLRYAFTLLEEDIYRASLVWVIILLVLYVPLIYIALYKIFMALENEIKVFLNLGVDRRKIVSGITIAIFTISSAVILFLVSLSMVMINALHKIISIYLFSLHPYPRTHIALIVLIVLCLNLVISMVIGLREIRYG